METYATLEDTVVGLFDLDANERAFAERLVALYRDGVEWRAFSDLVAGRENPVVRDAGGRVTRDVWEHPLFQMARDLEDRLGIAQGHVAPPEDRTQLDRDPFADEWTSVADAAERKGVTPQAIYGAIRRGDIVARPRKPGDPWTQVSEGSLQTWAPNEMRQAARRKGTAVV